MTDHDPAAETATFCAVHPDRETALRCNKCGRLMCADCAVSTPVGYRCRECVRQHENQFYKGTAADYVLAFGVSAVLGALGLFVLSLLGGFLLFVILLALPIGGGIGEAVLRLTGRRRGRYSGAVAAAGVVAGVLALGLVVAGQIVLTPTSLIYAGVVAATVYGRFRLRI